MPLHDWSDDRGWDSVHFLWLAQLIDWVQPRLPGSRAYAGADQSTVKGRRAAVDGGSRARLANA